MNIDYLQPIFDILSADADILTIITTGDNIYFNDAPADTDRYIVLYEVDSTNIGNSKTHTKRIQLNMYHTDARKCAELAEYVKSALHTFQGEQSGVVFASIYNLTSLGMTQTDNGEYIIIQDYRVIY